MNYLSRPFFALFVLMTALFALSACEDEPNTETVLEEALANIKIVEETDSDILLPQSIDGFGIHWSSSDEEHLGPDGSVKRPDYDTGDVEVTLTAAIEKDDIQREAAFPVTIVSYSEADTVNMRLQAALSDVEIAAVTAEDLTLPETADQYPIEWVSLNPSVIDSTGEIVRPTTEEGDVHVTLIALVREGDHVQTKVFDVTVTALDGEATLEAAKTHLEGKDFLDEPLRNDLDLPDVWNEVSISWESDNTDVLTDEGTFTRPLHHEGDQEVNLTATLERNGQTMAVTFMLDAAAKGIEASAARIVNEALASIDWLHEPIEGNIDFPDEVGMVQFAWLLEDDTYIDKDGQVNPPLHMTGDQDVPIVATIRLSHDAYGHLEWEYPLKATVSAWDEPSIIETRTLDFINLADEWLLDDSEIDVHYIREGGMPYVDLMEFLALLDGGEEDGAIHFDDLDIVIEDGVIIIENHVEYEDELYDDMIYTMEIDFGANNAITSQFGMFRSFHVSPITDFGMGLEVADYEYELEEPVFFDFEHYRIEIFEEEGKHLMPLHLANLFFSGSMFDVYYNGDEIYGFDTYQRHDSRVRDKLLESSYNEMTMTRAKRIDTYNHLVFSFDHFYGLRMDQGVETYYDVFSQLEVTRGGQYHYASLLDLVLDLDDLHTSFLTTGMYAPDYTPTLYLGMLGPRSRMFYQRLWSIEDYYLADERHANDHLILDENSVVLYDDGRVARVPISGFDADTGAKFANVLDYIDDLGTVEEIIIDLTYNTGGIVGGMIQVLGHMTDEPIPLRQLNAGDLSTSTTYYESEMEARDYEWHILSSRVTYSAGNMMVQVAKEMGIANIIGQKSAGGAASITTNILPSGAIIMMSSPNLSADDNHESIEMGIEVDIELPVADFLDEEAILAALEEAKQD